MKVTTNIPAGTEVLVKGTVVAVGGTAYTGKLPVKIGQYTYWLEAGLIAGVVPPQDYTMKSKFSNREIIQDAIDHCGDISFFYQKENGMVEERYLSPERMFTSRDGRVLVGGYDLDEAYGDSYRAFRLDRIQGEVEIN